MAKNPLPPPKQIPITPSGFALVDEQDFEELSKYHWHDTGRYVARAEYLGKDDSGNYKHTTISMHRHILKAPTGVEVDHINHSRYDNRRSNLRLATRLQNIANTLPQKRAKSRYKGVSFYRGKRKPWCSRIAYQGKRLSLGLFSTEESAALAYNKKAQELFGKFAYLNEIGDR